MILTETQGAVVSGAIQRRQGDSYPETFGVAKIYRDVSVCQLNDRTSDVQHMVIARTL